MSTPIRLGLVYATIFLGAGASSPYMPVWFARQGLSGGQIGLILSLPMIARLMTAPALAVWADSLRLRRSALVILAAGAGGGYLLMALPLGFAWWMAVWFAASSAASTIIPLTDVIGLARARQDGFNYGWPRGFGSMAFIVANIALGLLLTHGTPEAVLAWMVAAAAATALGARFLAPADTVHGAEARAGLAERMAGLGGLLRDPLFLTVVVSAGLIQSAHAFYYGFSTLAWKREGISEGVAGVLWATGVAVEIVFMWAMEAWRRTLGPRRLLVIGGVAAVIRWTALAATPPLWLLFPLQALHALTYAATFLASLQLVEMLSTPRNASAAQSINAALSSGVMSGLATLASGWLFDRVGVRGYLLMAVMSVLGLAGAFRLLAAKRLNA